MQGITSAGRDVRQPRSPFYLPHPACYRERVGCRHASALFGTGRNPGPAGVKSRRRGFRERPARVDRPAVKRRATGRRAARRPRLREHRNEGRRQGRARGTGMGDGDSGGNERGPGLAAVARSLQLAGFAARRVAPRWLHKDKPAERFPRAFLIHPRFGHSLRKTAARARNAGYEDLLEAGPAARAIRISVLEGAALRCRPAVTSRSRGSMPGPCGNQAGRGRCGPFTATCGWVRRSISVASERGPRLSRGRTHRDTPGEPAGERRR